MLKLKLQCPLVVPRPREVDFTSSQDPKTGGLGCPLSARQPCKTPAPAVRRLHQPSPVGRPHGRCLSLPRLLGGSPRCIPETAARPQPDPLAKQSDSLTDSLAGSESRGDSWLEGAPLWGRGRNRRNPSSLEGAEGTVLRADVKTWVRRRGLREHHCLERRRLWGPAGNHG